ncbi:cytochrome c oxidase assembly protein [uncultured Ferrovibrio sp.]|jgi:cytochrome c oxidase assembly protein subunit 11|uniref:cytochrome c oxidase assembly protein n=1 Tax=uncultured Ferrovibrio sp. TaxID=1576913 RepID=UPI00261CA620|nr:cytochrome c oxidase assembly protein [uncultured Ferrovibrio sp.]
MTRPNDARNRRIAWSCAAVVAGMVGLSFASVPLYDLFCRVTGFGGTPQRAESAPAIAKPQEQLITVRFNADTGRDMPWKFQPAQREVKVKPGEETLIFYRASNPTDKPIVGQATFNVTPDKAGQYFNKIACFCFEEQRLEPGQTVDMPVSFFVDPDMLTDPKTREVHTITLSYTFFRHADEEKKLSDRGGNVRTVN